MEHVWGRATSTGLLRENGEPYTGDSEFKLEILELFERQPHRHSHLLVLSLSRSSIPYIVHI